MKTTLDLDTALVAQAEAIARREGKSLSSIVEEGLRLRLQGGRKTGKRERIVIAVHTGRGGLVPGVDPLSNRSLLDAVDGDRPTLRRGFRTASARVAPRQRA